MLAKTGPGLNWPGTRCRPRLGEPLSGIWCSSATPHYLAGLRKVPAEVPALVLAPRREFFVASSAVGVSRLSCLSSSTVRLSSRESLKSSRVARVIARHLVACRDAWATARHLVSCCVACAIVRHLVACHVAWATDHHLMPAGTCPIVSSRTRGRCRTKTLVALLGPVAALVVV